MTDVVQQGLCARIGSPFVPAPPFLKVGIALGTIGLRPLNGVRHLPAGDTAGWYIWAGEVLSEDDDFFQSVHVAHLADYVPEVIPYLGLAPGWRFLIAGVYEDVWFDAAAVIR